MNPQTDRVNSATSVQPPDALPGSGIDRWLLDPNIVFLHHGCFGATPRCVLERQLKWRERFERHPVELLARRSAELLNEAKAPIGRRFGMEPANFGFMTNATSGVNAVLRSRRFEAGDELLTTNHVYNAVRQTMRYVARQSGATYREIDVPLPVSSPEDIVAAVANNVNDNTRIVVLDHVSSPTGLIFPVERIARLCREREVDLLIDGAHAPGMIELDIESLGVPYYAGNLHKWMCAPKGAGFLWVRDDRQGDVHPLTVSHHLDEGLSAEFAWQGTCDITPWLCAADSLAFLEEIGFEAMLAHNHQLAVWAQQVLTRAWRVEPLSPLDGTMIGSMATVTLPAGLRDKFASAEQLQATLYERGFEVPVIEWPPGEDAPWRIRVSCALYNRPEDYERLANDVLRL